MRKLTEYLCCLTATLVLAIAFAVSGCLAEAGEQLDEGLDEAAGGDDIGTTQTALTTVSKVPTRDVSNSGTTQYPASPASRFDKIDDGVGFALANNDTDFVYRSGTTTPAGFRVGFSGIQAGVVRQVTVNYRARATTVASAPKVRVSLFSGSTLLATGTDKPLTTAYQNFTTTFSGLNVTDGNQLVVAVTFTGTDQMRVTQLWIDASVGKNVYVATTGSDTTGNGSASAPYKTFAKAFGTMTAGDTLNIYAGTYAEQLNVTKSGTAAAYVTVRNVAGQTVVLDGAHVRDAPVNVPSTSSYVILSGLTCKRGSVSCVLVKGSNVVVSDFDVYGAKKFGVRSAGSNVTVQNSRIHDNVLENANGALSNGWGAGLRSAQGTTKNVFRNNRVYQNWGEGIIMGANNSSVYGNVVYDNYSKNIYVGNTFVVNVFSNLTYAANSTWFRGGNPADCISASEEKINDTYGAQLRDVKIYNNIASGCKGGVGYTYAEVTGNGCDNCLFAFNTIIPSTTASGAYCVKVIAGSKNDVEIADNICRTGAITVPSVNVSVHHNHSGPASLTGGVISDPNSYRPLAGSPVIGKGVNVGIPTDYFSVARTTRFDIGAIQAP